MTHDPLCPMWSKVVAGDTCECELIAKVREDALAAAVQRVEALPDLLDAGFTYSDLLHRASAIAAIKGDQP